MTSQTTQYDNLSQDHQNLVNRAIFNKVIMMGTLGSDGELGKAATACLNRSLMTDNDGHIRKDNPEFALKFLAERRPDVDPKLSKIMTDYITEQKNVLSAPNQIAALQAAAQANSYKPNEHEQRSVNNLVTAYSDINEYKGDPTPGVPVRSGVVNDANKGISGR